MRQQSQHADLLLPACLSLHLTDRACAGHSLCGGCLAVGAWVGRAGAMGIGYFNASNLYRFLPISVYAFIYHHSIPGLSHPVRDKKQLGSIFLLT